jgi:hypothetical protein
MDETLDMVIFMFAGNGGGYPCYGSDDGIGVGSKGLAGQLSS